MSRNKNQFELSKCKNIVSKNFEIKDFLYCLGTLAQDKAEMKAILQKEFIKILNNSDNNNEIKKIILERGINMGYCDKLVQNTSVEKVTETLASRLQTNSKELESRNFKMKNLYFYKNVKNISGWKFVKTSDIETSTFLEFVLPQNFYQEFDKSNENEFSQSCFFLRCAKLEKNGKESQFKDCYPVLMRMFINKHELTNLLPREIYHTTLDRKERIPVPTVLNEIMLKFPEFCMDQKTIQLEFQFSKKENEKQEFAFAVFTSTKITTNDICQEILKKKKISLKQFDTDLNELMIKSKDISLESIKISLLSSTTFKRIKIPFRGKNCHHINPDDLEDFIESNKKYETWLCKICKSTCTPDDILVDEFFMNVLQKHSNVTEVKLYSEMKYKLLGCDEFFTINNHSFQKSIQTKKTGTIKKNKKFDARLTKRKSFEPKYQTRSITKLHRIECIIIDDDSDVEPQPKRINTTRKTI